MNAPVTRVTVLEDRAAVTRAGTFALAAGQHRITIDRVSPVLVDKTLIGVATGGRVLDVRCERYLAPWRDPSAGSTELASELRQERTALVGQRELQSARAAAATAEANALSELAGAALADLATGATRGLQVPTPAARLAEIDTLEAEARARRALAELASAELARQISRLDQRIARAEAEAGEEAARLHVDILVETAGAVGLSIDYVVPGAAWRPYHRAVLTRPTGQVQWQTTACVWQATGEDWVDAALTFSLERPSLGIEPPDLVDDELRARRRPEHVTVEVREQEHHTAGLGSAGAPEVPGIDDGGLALVLTAAAATVRADGAPHRIPVGGFVAAAQVTLVAIPLRSPWVHVRARIVNPGPLPLLAGPVDLVMASGYVGRTEIDFVGPNEKFYVGFGPESELRVHRTETKDRDDAGLLGGWNTTTTRVAVRVSNLGASPRTILVTERIPISEVEQVNVQLGAPDAYLLATDNPEEARETTQITARALDDRGMVTWSVELPPHGRRAVTLEYKVKSQKHVAGV